jgi:hypothetical protein
MKKIVVLSMMIACGGQTIGDLDSGTGTDASTKSDVSLGASCIHSSDCSIGTACAYPMADGCAAKGHCVDDTGPLCNSFSPGCACDGTTINIVCNGLPDGFATKPLASKGQCTTSIDGGSTYACGNDTCIPGKEICYQASNPTTFTCLPSGQCTDCQCAQSMFQCISTCKQSGLQIYVQCQ